MEENILVVDDERELADLVALYLRNEGFGVTLCYDGAAALERIDRESFALAILDVMLPGVDGYELCRRIREKHVYPIIMLTAKGEELDRITGLALGADDYVAKPFRPLELVARVKAQLRRYTTYNGGEHVERALALRGLVLDPASHSCKLNERELELTPTEFSILQYLLERAGRAVPSEELFEGVWGERYLSGSNNTVMVHIRHLREKLGDSPEHPKYIRTVWGVGYKIEK